jgi:hypothetical protein
MTDDPEYGQAIAEIFMTRLPGLAGINETRIAGFGNIGTGIQDNSAVETIGSAVLGAYGALLNVSSQPYAAV